MNRLPGDGGAAGVPERLGGLEVTITGRDAPTGAPVVVMLHGYAMTSTDLSPFAAIVKRPVRFVFPEGPIPVRLAGGTGDKRTFWPVDAARRAASLALGPRDFWAERPAGRDEARALIEGLLDDVVRTLAPSRLVLGGFSQGAMLAVDVALRGGRRPDALVLLAGSRVAADDWAPLLTRVRGMPVFISHGRDDQDVAFAAGEALRDELATAGAAVTWVPFDGGHQVALSSWRALNAFLAPVVAGTPAVVAAG